MRLIPRVTTLVTLAMVLPVLLLQWRFAARMDRTLPKLWRRLPTLSFYGNRVFLIRRWVRTGKPRIHGLRHPKDDSA